MNNPTVANRKSPSIYLTVSLVFLILALGLQTLVWLYWGKVLKPRLHREATNQANVLAHSQAVKLADVLVTTEPARRYKALHETVDEILLFTDPESRTPMFLGLDLKVDYDVLNAPAGSLDLVHGESSCRDCFISEVGLYSPLTDELIGIARLRVSETLFQRLSHDVKKTLFTQSHLGILLLIIVWVVLIFLIREVNRSRRQAETASRAKSAFLANMSHELRTPLNAIIGFSELMQHDQKLPSAHRENLAIINRSGEYLLDLINDVLELSKIEATGDTLVERSFDLYDTLDKVTEMISYRAKRKNLHLDFERSPTLPRFITSDERKLRQILLNLLGNGVKFTEEGGVTLRVRTDQKEISATTNGTIRLNFEIEDSGHGINEDELETVFDAFTQTESGYDKKEGTGLGLAITRQFIRQLGGEIQVDSKIGQGTVFRFTIPVSAVNVQEIRPERNKRRVIGIKPGEEAENQSHRILVVDDHQANRDLLRLLLERAGFAVKVAANGLEAVRLNESWTPDLIWMDMRMPVMDGYEATKNILSSREKDGREKPVIIALTASAFKEDREAVLAAGCNDFLRRPFREDEIFTMLGNHLDIKFTYEEIDDVYRNNEASHQDGTGAWHTAITRLPEAVITELKTAVELSDMDKMDKLVESMKDEELAAGLKKMIDSFQYDRLLCILEDASENSNFTQKHK